MDIAIQSNLIVIRTKRAILDTPWMRDYVALSNEDLLFLSRAVIIYHNQANVIQKKEFLTKACEHFIAQTTMQTTFFHKALMHCLHYPIKIETEKSHLPKPLSVGLHATHGHEVTITLNTSDALFWLYIDSKLPALCIEKAPKMARYQLQTLEAKNMLERALQRDRIFSRKIIYSYETSFMRTLFDPTQALYAKAHYYAILGCDAGAPMEVVKSSYKKLAQTYHPDKILHLNDHTKIHMHTRKFQLLQEAYRALKGA